MSTASASDKGSIGILGELVGVGLAEAVGTEVGLDVVGSIDTDGLATGAALGLCVTITLGLGVLVTLFTLFVVGLDERPAITAPIAIAVANAPPHITIHSPLLLPLLLLLSWLGA